MVGRVVKDVLDTHITIFMCDLVAVVPDVCSGICSKNTNHHIPVDTAKLSKVVTFDLNVTGDALYLGLLTATLEEVVNAEPYSVNNIAPVLMFKEEAPLLEAEDNWDNYSKFASLFAMQPGEYDLLLAAEGLVFLVPMEPLPFAILNMDITPEQLRTAEETVLKANSD